MSRITRFLIGELRQALPPTCFFLVVFHVAALNRALMEETYGITPENSAAATIMALIMGKVILVVNKLHFVNRFSGRPLVLPVLWKTALFGILGSMFQILEEGVPLAYRLHSVSAGVGRLMDEMVWPKFIANHILLLVWLLIFCVAVELIREFGAEEMKQLLFGHRDSRVHRNGRPPENHA
jgi:hypothetical protein